MKSRKLWGFLLLAGLVGFFIAYYNTSWFYYFKSSQYDNKSQITFHIETRPFKGVNYPITDALIFFYGTRPTEGDAKAFYIHKIEFIDKQKNIISKDIQHYDDTSKDTLIEKRRVIDGKNSYSWIGEKTEERRIIDILAQETENFDFNRHTKAIIYTSAKAEDEPYPVQLKFKKKYHTSVNIFEFVEELISYVIWRLAGAPHA